MNQVMAFIILALGALLPNETMAEAVADATKGCAKVTGAERAECYEFLRKCEDSYLRPSDATCGPGGDTDAKIDGNYQAASLQVASTEGYSPNTETASGACSDNLPARKSSIDNCRHLRLACAEKKGVNNKVSCNDFLVQTDTDKKGICDYIASNADLMNQKFTHETGECNKNTAIDRAVTAEAPQVGF